MGDLPIINVNEGGSRHTKDAASPFRYPGGKGFLTAFLAKKLAGLGPAAAITFCEPFCGGAGAALNLLWDRAVGAVRLNDADVRIHSAWRAMLDEGDRFIERVREVPLTMDEWFIQHDLVSRPPSGYSFELGFATFYMNRTTRSGIVERAGPIGGYDQTGKWKIDARFNRDRLANQIRWISDNRSRIDISNLDALSFIDKAKRNLDLGHSFFFIDPPYVKAGGRLYLNGMSEAKHIALGDILLSGAIPHWVLTYDDAPIIRQIYRPAVMSTINVNYSLQQKRKEAEILVVPA